MRNRLMLILLSVVVLISLLLVVIILRVIPIPWIITIGPTPTTAPTCASPSTTATRVYGQPNFTTGTPNMGGLSAHSLYFPEGVALDASGSLYIAEELNSRVMRYPPGSVTADLVFGQPDFTTSGNNTGGLSAASLADSTAAVPDGSGGLYIVDKGNHRALHYPGGSVKADRVYGQSNFTSGTSNTGGISATSLNFPFGVAVDNGGGLYVVDSDNHRALHYPAGSVTADRLYGQPSFTTNLQNNGGISATSLFFPKGIVVDRAGGIYIADYSNSRVLHYPANSTIADRVYGQPNFTTGTQNTGGISATSLSIPAGMALDRCGGLYVADFGNSRVLRFPAGSTTADRVYGQPNFTSGTSNSGGLSARSFSGPTAVALDECGGLYTADTGNHRALYFPGCPTPVPDPTFNA